MTPRADVPQGEPRVGRSWSLAALLAALAMLGPFSIDMYLPAFSAIEQDFRTTPLAVQQTLSAYLLAYAFLMLWHGALSDALGRRPIVLGGLGDVPGAVVGGLVIGLAEAFVPSEYVAYKDAVAFALLFVMLLARPQGLLGRAAVQKV